MRHLGDHPVRARAPAQILRISRLEEIHAVALAALDEGHRLRVGRIRLQIIDCRNAASGIVESGMRGDIVDTLIADIDDTPVAQSFEGLLSRSQHFSLSVAKPSHNVASAERTP